MAEYLAVTDFIATLPARVGYELVDQASITLISDTGSVITIGVLTATVDDQLLRSTLAEVRERCRTEQLTPARLLLTVHHPTASHEAHRARAEKIAAIATEAGLPQVSVGWAVNGQQAWPLDDPSARMPLASSSVRTSLELLNGRPARTLEEALAQYAPATGPLRDALSVELPNAAGEQRAALSARGAREWRWATTIDLIARLSDPQPWTGPQAARALLGLSDAVVREHLVAHSVDGLKAVDRESEATALTPDTGQLADLVRHAPPGLVAGPAEVLAATLFAGSGPGMKVLTAARAALDDDPACSIAPRLLEALQAPRWELCAELAHPTPLTGPISETDVGFLAGPDQWPDPLATIPPASDPWAGWDDDTGPEHGPNQRPTLGR